MSPRVPAGNIRLKRAYETPSGNDGVRVLIDRLWPRGVTRKAAALDQWLKEVAPSNDLREWFGHDPARWQGFKSRYTKELRRHERQLRESRSIARRGPLTLVYSAHDVQHNDAVVLRNVLLGR